MLEHIYTGSLNQQQAIYHTHTNVTLANHLESVYITCNKMVGVSFFKKACLEYIRQYCLTEYDLTFYGEFFSTHLANIIEHKLPKTYIKNEGLNCLPDVAKWEWAIHRALCGPNNFNVFNHVDFLSDLDFKNKQVVFPEGCTIIKSDYPLEKIWRAHQTKAINQKEYVLNIQCGEYYWWIGLVENDLLIQPLSKSTWFFLHEVKCKGLSVVLENTAIADHTINFSNELVESLRKGRLILL